MKFSISLKSGWLRWVGIGLTAVSFLFLGKSLLSMRVDFSRFEHPVKVALLLAALSACYAAVVYFSAFIWRMVLQFISRRRLRFVGVADIYVRANIAKYLPGNVMHFAGRNMLAKKLAFSQIDVAFSSVLEIVMLLITAVAWSAALSYRSFVSMLGSLQKQAGVSLYIILAAVAALAAVACVVLRRKKLLRKYRRFFTPAFARLVPQLFVLYSLTMVVPGLFLGAFLGMLGVTVTPTLLLRLFSAYMISWVAGYVVIGSPGGIGVRESIMVLLIGSSVGSDVAVLGALLLRLSSVLGDGLAYLAQILWNRRRAARHLSDEPIVPDDNSTDTP